MTETTIGGVTEVVSAIIPEELVLLIITLGLLLITLRLTTTVLPLVMMIVMTGLLVISLLILLTLVCLLGVLRLVIVITMIGVHFLRADTVMNLVMIGRLLLAEIGPFLLGGIDLFLLEIDLFLLELDLFLLAEICPPLEGMCIFLEMVGPSAHSRNSHLPCP